MLRVKVGFVCYRITKLDGSEQFGLLPRHGYFASAREVNDAERLHQGQKFFDFAFVAGDFNGKSVRLDIDDFGAEDISDLHDFGASFGIDGDFDEHQFAVHEFPFAKVLDLQDVRQFVQLLDDLFERGVIAARDNGHAGGGGIGSRGNVQGIDIVASTAEQPGD